MQANDTDQAWPDFSALDTVPRHVAIIMDGNNRWARKRNLKGVSGHKAGVGSLQTTVEGCARAGVEVLTLFAFSSENWRRPNEEISGLMELFSWALTREIDKVVENNLRLRVVGDRAGFSRSIQKSISTAEARTSGNTGMWVVIAANYGGRWDIAQAARSLAAEVAAGQRSPESIDENTLGEYTTLRGFPDPDLCIRTAGESRLSNFLLWHLAYSELIFMPVLWPDFSATDLFSAFKEYAGRSRRFGGRHACGKSSASRPGRVSH